VTEAGGTHRSTPAAHRVPWESWLPILPVVVVAFGALSSPGAAGVGLWLSIPCGFAVSASVAFKHYHTLLERGIVFMALGTGIVVATACLAWSGCCLSGGFSGDWP
jgi:hypothetical protein